MTDRVSIREVRSQWVEFMCTFTGIHMKQHYEGVFDNMLDAHNREVIAGALGRAKVSLPLDNLANTLFTAGDGHPSIGIRTNAEAKNQVLKGLDDLAKEYLRRRGEGS